MDFEFTIATSKSFDVAVRAVEEASAAGGFRVLHIHDVQATLAEKGFLRDPLKIIEVCNARYASQVLLADVRIALMLPCPIAVYVQGSQTKISTMRPSALVDFFPDAGIEKLAQEIDDAIMQIVKTAACATSAQ